MRGKWPIVQPSIRIKNVTVNVTISANSVSGDVSAINSEVRQRFSDVIGNEIQAPLEAPIAHRHWFEKWWGIALIGIVVAVIGAGIAAALGWT